MIDYLDKPGKDLLLDLINDDNRATFTFEQVSFSPPTAVSQNQDERNTSAIVTALPESPWFGSVTVAYERLFLDRLFVDQDLEVSSDESQTEQLILDGINAEFGLLIQPTDVEFVGSIPLPGYDGSILMRAKAGSYVYLGEVVVLMKGNKIQLPAYVTHTVLDGLHYPEGDVSKLTAVKTGYQEALPANAANASGIILIAPVAADGAYFAYGTNTEVVLDIGVAQDGPIGKNDNNVFKLYEATGEDFAVSFALQSGEFAVDGKITSLYDLRIRLARNDNTSVEFTATEAAGVVTFKAPAEAGMADIVATVTSNGAVVQVLLPLDTYGTIDDKAVTLAAIRKVGFAPRVLAHFPFDARFPA